VFGPADASGNGLVDNEHGNFFDALALTPGPKGSTDPSDDGFLTLAEIYELSLKGCEPAILSACQTNYGPEQWGEGVWALSRGFLVAGSRRVVASNWLVDDEAGASLISTFAKNAAFSHATGDTSVAVRYHNRQNFNFAFSRSHGQAQSQGDGVWNAERASYPASN
jgi:CHAT domain